jgi:hypothetical protein
MSTVFGLGSRFIEDARRWCAGRLWFIRLPLLLLLAYAWIRHLSEPQYQSIFKGLNLGIHELGHYVFQPFGDIPSVLGGSILQCLVPIVAMGMFLRQRDYFAISVAFGWLAVNFFEVATYVADAVDKRLPLVTPGGGEPIHDWNYILGSWGWLRHAETVASLHRLCGNLCMVICLVFGSWLTWKMLQSSARRPGSLRRSRGKDEAVSRSYLKRS